MTDETAIARQARQDRRAELTEVKLGRNGALFSPTNGTELADMGRILSGMGLMISPIFRDRPGECMGLIAMCAPYGLSPVQVSWKAYKASKGDDAPIAYEAQVVAAMINGSGKLVGDCLSYEYDGEGPMRRVTVSGEMRADGTVRTLTTPALKDIGVKNSPLWKSDVDQQLSYYGARAWARRFMPQMLLGVISIDEAREMQTGPDHARDVTPKRGGTAKAEPLVPVETVADEAAEAEPVAEYVTEDGEIIDAETAAEWGDV